MPSYSKLIVSSLLCFTFSLPAFAEKRQPVAYVVAVSGDVTVSGQEGPLEQFELIYPGYTLIFSENAETFTLQLTDGKRQELIKDGRMGVEATKAKPFVVPSSWAPLTQKQLDEREHHWNAAILIALKDVEILQEEEENERGGTLRLNMPKLKNGYGGLPHTLSGNQLGFPLKWFNGYEPFSAQLDVMIGKDEKNKPVWKTVSKEDNIGARFHYFKASELEGKKWQAGTYRWTIKDSRKNAHGKENPQIVTYDFEVVDEHFKDGNGFEVCNHADHRQSKKYLLAEIKYAKCINKKDYTTRYRLHALMRAYHRKQQLSPDDFTERAGLMDIIKRFQGGYDLPKPRNVMKSATWENY